MKHLKKYKLFESIDSDLEDIKDIMSDISDLEDIGVNVEVVVDVTLSSQIGISIFPEKGGFFKVNENIKSVIQRLNHLYKDDYTISYKYSTNRDPIVLWSQVQWVKFYVYDDERGLRD